MADELNIPIHRWYEPRNNISLPNSDFSKQWIYDSGIQKIDRWINSQPWGNPINALFALAEPGVWFDPSDVANLDWRVNQLTWTEDFSNPIWVKQAGTTVTVNQTVAPDGTTTADLVVGNGSSGVFVSAIPVSTTSANTKSIWLRGVSGGEVVFLKDPSLTIGTITCNLSTAWQRFSLSEIQTTGIAGLWVANIPSGGIYIWGAQLEVGSVATTYQRISDVNTEVIERFPTATLYQDPAGTTPVTAPGNTVGLMLDKSRGLVLGAELVSNPGGPFVNTTGWLPYQTGSNFSVVSGNLVTVDDCYFPLTGLTVGKTYEVRYSVISGGGLNLYEDANSAGPVYVIGLKGSGIYRVRVNKTELGLYLNASTTLASISVRELPGNHATQGTLTARPTYSIEPVGGRRNNLVWTEQFDNAVWQKVDTTVSPTQYVAPDGTMTADKFVPGNILTQHSFEQQPTAQPAAGDVVLSAYFKAGELTKAVVRTYDDVTFKQALFNLTSGTVETGSSTVPAGQATISSVGNGWFRCTLLGYTKGTALKCNLRLAPTSTTASDAGASWAGNSSDGGFIWGAQLEVGSTATPYQRVGSQYDVTEAGKPSMSYLYFDGVNDAMVTSTITPGTDKAQVFAGVRKLNNSTGVIAELSANFAVGGAFGLFCEGGPGAANNYVFGSMGTTAATAIASPFVAPITSVVTGIGDISGDRATARVNGTQVAQNTADQGGGNYLANPLYIGARGGTTIPFTGHLYSLITRFGPTLDAPTISNTETWVAGKTGFYTPIITGVPTIGVS